MHEGGCHCGTVKYEILGDPINHSLCHCSDCRGNSGAPMVGWLMLTEDALNVTQGEPNIYESSEHGRRHFCGDCGTGLFYSNSDLIPGFVDVQSATLENPDVLEPENHIQTMDRISWMLDAHKLPEFEAFPPQEEEDA